MNSKNAIAVIYNVHSLCVEINIAYETKLAYDVVGTRFDSKDQATRYLRCISTFKITKFTDVKALDMPLYDAKHVCHTRIATLFLILKSFLWNFFLQGSEKKERGFIVRERVLNSILK